MEILVLVMLALFILIITFCVLVYVILRKNSVNKSFERKMNSDIDTFIEDDEYDELPNVVMPLNVHSNYQLDDNNDNKINDELLNIDNDINQNENIVNEMNVKNEVLEEENVKTTNDLVNNNLKDVNNSNVVVLDEETLDDEQVDDNQDDSLFLEYGFNNSHLESEIEVINDLETKNNKKERKEELINVLINKKNYPFLANNNHVNKNDHIKVLIDKKVCFGVVTKANYFKDISNMKNKPRKLIIIKNKEKFKSSSEIENKVSVDNLIDEIDFVPKKKKKV